MQKQKSLASSCWKCSQIHLNTALASKIKLATTIDLVHLLTPPLCRTRSSCTRLRFDPLSTCWSRGTFATHRQTLTESLWEHLQEPHSPDTPRAVGVNRKILYMTKWCFFDNKLLFQRGSPGFSSHWRTDTMARPGRSTPNTSSWRHGKFPHPPRSRAGNASYKHEPVIEVLI